MFDFSIYADDTTLSTTIEMVLRNITEQAASDVLNKELSMVNDWLRINILSSKNCVCFDIPMTVNNSPNCIFDKLNTHSS